MPTLVSDTESAFNNNTSPKTINGVAVQAGDLVLLWQAAEDDDKSFNVAPTLSGTATASAAAVVTGSEQSLNDQNGRVKCWYTNITGSGNLDSSFVAAGTAGQHWGAGVVVIRDHNGIGAVAGEAVANSVAPSLDITTTGANSSIFYLNSDWNTAAGARTYRQVNGASPTVITATVSSNYGIDATLYADAGAAGTKTVGMTAPTTMRESHCAIEILAAAGGTPVTATRALSYDVLNAVAATRALSYDVQAALSATRALSYDVANTVSATRALSYDLLAFLAATRALSYDVLNAVVATRALSYDVLEAGAPLSATRVLSYDVLNALAATRALSYDVLNALVAERALSYDLLNALTAERALSYDVLVALAATRALSYDVANTLAASRSLYYDLGDVETPAGVTRQGLWYW